MDEASRQRLAEITSHEPAALSEPDRAFLCARQAYLTEDQKVVFAEILGKKGASSTASQAKPQEPSLDELKARGEAFGLKYKVGMKKVDFQKAVEDAEAGSPDEEADQEELQREADEAAANGQTSDTPDEEV